LADAGKSDLTFDMIANADSATIRVAEILKQQWADVGVTMNIRPLEIVQGTSDYFNDRKTPAYLSQWTGRPDPAMTYRLLFSADGYFNTSDKWTPGLEEALKKSDASTEPSERKAGSTRPPRPCSRTRRSCRWCSATPSSVCPMTSKGS